MEPFASKTLYVMLAFLLFLLQPFHSQSNSDPLHYHCSADYYNDTTKIGANIQALLTSLLDSGPTTGFFNNTVGEFPDQFYGLVLCRADINTKSCRNCLQTATNYIQKSCLISQSLSAILWYEKCLLRYSNDDFFGVADTDGFLMYDRLNASKAQDSGFFRWKTSGQKKRNQKAFVTTLVETAPTKPLLYEIRHGRNYGVAQCTRDLTARTCRNCLTALADQLDSCCYGKKTWRFLANSCGIWYAHQFFTSTDLRNLLLALGSLILTLLLFIFWEVTLLIGGWILWGIGKLLLIPLVPCVLLWYIGKWILLGISKLLCSPFRICKGNDIEEGGVSKPTYHKNEGGGDGTKVDGGVTKPRDIPPKGNEARVGRNKPGGSVSIPRNKNEVGGGGTKVGGSVTKNMDIPSMGTKLGGGVSISIDKMEVGGGGNKVGGIPKPTNIPTKGKEVGGGRNGEGVSILRELNEVAGGGNKVGGSASKPPSIPSKGNEVRGSGTKFGESVSKPTNKNEVDGDGNKVGGVSKPPKIPSKGKEVLVHIDKSMIKQPVKKEEGEEENISMIRAPIDTFSDGNNVGGSGDGDKLLGTPELRFIDISILREATKNFSNENELGRGGFGVVYKGTLNDGMEVAVKKLKTTGRRPKDFVREVQSLAGIRHKNVVKLHCYCIDGEEYYLVYEFMPNKSLADNLFNKTTSEQLDMEKRGDIIHGIGKGIRYLHEESGVTIIHRDLKPENILLDSKKNPKIADFGNAKIFNDEQIEAYASEPIATRGYMPREYLLGREYSTATDVFSFGVLLLEIISAERNCSFHNLLAKAWSLWSTGKHIDFVDPFLINSCSVEAMSQEIEKKLLRWIHVGLLCVQGDPTPRPTVAKVLHMLEGDFAIDLPLTKPPIEYATKYTTQLSLLPINESSFNEETTSDTESESE